MLALFALVQIFYWLALSTWFGGVLFVAIAAPIIFKTIRDNNPILPTVLSVNLEDQHASLLAGAVVGNLLNRIVPIELGCAAVLLVTIIAQWFLADISANEWVLSVIRTALYIAAVGLVLYDWRVIWPRIWKYRQEYIDHADEPEVANPAKDQFDRYHRESVTVMSLLLMLLLGLVLFSALIVPRQAHTWSL